MFFGSVTDTENQVKQEDGTLLDRPLTIVRAITKPQTLCENTEHSTNDYKITTFVFIVLFVIMLIGSLVLYFTGMLKFQFSVLFGRGTPY